MRVLFVHQNFPAQYVHIAAALAATPGVEVVALSMRDVAVPGVRNVRHFLDRGSTRGIHPLAADFESKVIRGESAARAALQLRAEGFTPDVICCHPGWGESLFLKDVWPDARVLSFVEFVYRSAGADVDFDPEFVNLTNEGRFNVRSKNAGLFLAFESSDWFVSPTAWQARHLPRAYARRISIVHDGIDTERVRPNKHALLVFDRQGIRATPGDEIVTFVNRNLEPYRGYHSFMRALPEIMRRRPKAHIVIVGGDGVSYGAAPPSGRRYRDIFLDEVKADLDMTRIHFVGTVPYAVYLTLLQVSAVHVYLTYPFVLSWSLMEAMAAGCAVVASSTPPVEEVVTHEETGLLVDFFSPAQIARAVTSVLERPRAYTVMRRNAREAIVSRYDLQHVCLPEHLKLIEKVARL